MDGVTLLLLLVFFGMVAVLSGPGRSRRDAIMRGQHDARIRDALYRSTHTDVTGMVVCRRCGADAHERGGACARCGAPL